MKTLINKTFFKKCVFVIIFLIAGRCNADIIKHWTRIWGSSAYDSGSEVSVDSAGTLSRFPVRIFSARNPPTVLR